MVRTRASREDTCLFLLVVGLILAEHGTAAAAAVVVRPFPHNLQQPLSRAGDEINRGLIWVSQHMQWDFDDIDPYMPLSPFWRFDHKIKSKFLLPLGHDSIRFSTTVRPTGRRGWVTSTINPFDWLQMQGTVVSQGLSFPVMAGSAEVRLPLDAVTSLTDNIFNSCLESVQLSLVGRTVAGGVHTSVLVGAGTRDEPWVGMETDARLSMSETGRPLRLRTRVSCDRDMQVLTSPPLPTPSPPHPDPAFPPVIAIFVVPSADRFCCGGRTVFRCDIQRHYVDGSIPSLKVKSPSRHPIQTRWEVLLTIEPPRKGASRVAMALTDTDCPSRRPSVVPNLRVVQGTCITHTAFNTPS